MIRRSLSLAALAAAIAVGGAAIGHQHQGQHHQGMNHGAGGHQPWHDALHKAVASPTRTAANTARDKYRHPFETLAFFGVKPSDTVVEIWPSGGWYTEILAPYLAQGGGSYWAASIGPTGNDGMKRLMTANPELYGKIRLAAFPTFEPTDTGVPDGSADVVLTFRNVHNWGGGYRREGKAYDVEAFQQMFRMLKPGGTLGVVDHRLPEGADAAREKNSGYIKVSTVRRLDTADWPDGVWTLPPSLRLKEVDRDRYVAIGESDRMTLKFVKPN